MSTISQVAARARVSSTTVSHVINNTRFVSEATRQRVLQAIDELNYRPNALARSLRRGETHTLGLVLPDCSNPFFAELSRAIEAAAFEQGYSLVLGNTAENPQAEELYAAVMAEKQMDGMIWIGSGEPSRAIKRILAQQLPVVLIDRELPEAALDLVVSDHLLGGILATRHLIEQGHRRIACISGPPHLAASAQRVMGYRRALEEACLPVDAELIVAGDFHPRSGWLRAQELLRLPDPPTALFCGNDLMAIGALRAAAEANLPVPESLAVVGFDQIELSAYTSPPLTTVAQPNDEIGRQAVTLLLERIHQPNLPPRRLVLPPRLIVRASSGGAL